VSSTIIATENGPRSSCCRAEVEVTKDYTDTNVYVVDEMEVDESGKLIEARYRYVKTYDGLDGENFTVRCRGCLADIDESGFDLVEG